MQILLLVPLMYLAAAMETSLADTLRIGDIAPDLLALAAAAWVLVVRSPYAFLGAGLIGLAGDLLAPGRIGAGAAGWLVVGYGLGQLRAWLGLEHLLLRIPAAALAIAVWALLVGLIRSVLGEPSPAVALIVSRALWTGLYTAAVSIPILLVLGWLPAPEQAEM